MPVVLAAIDDAPAIGDGASMDDPDALLPVESAGNVAGISPRTLRYWVKGGKLPATEGQRGKLVRLGDVLAIAELTGKLPAAGRQSDGNTAVSGTAARSAVGNAGSAGHLPAVAEAARVHLEAIRDEWLRPLMERNEDIARQLGRVETERDHLRAEVDRLLVLAAGDTSPQDAPSAAPGPPGEAEPPRPVSDALMFRWRRWLRRMTEGG